MGPGIKASALSPAIGKEELRWQRPPSFLCGRDGGGTGLPDSPQGRQGPQPKPSGFPSSAPGARERAPTGPRAAGARSAWAPPGLRAGSRLPGLPGEPRPYVGGRPWDATPRPTPPAPPAATESPGTFFSFFGRSWTSAVNFVITGKHPTT